MGVVLRPAPMKFYGAIFFTRHRYHVNGRFTVRTGRSVFYHIVSELRDDVRLYAAGSGTVAPNGPR